MRSVEIKEIKHWMCMGHIKCLHAPTMTFELAPFPEPLRYELLALWILVEMFVGVLGDGDIRAEYLVLASKLF